MLTRRRFLGGAAAAALLLLRGDVMLGRRLLIHSTGTGSFTPPAQGNWAISGAATLLANLSVLFTAAEFTVNAGGGPVEAVGYKPATDNTYQALWTRDHAYVVWHYPELLTAAERRQFVTYYLSRRTTGAEADPDGGTFPPDWIPDRISATGTATYKNAGTSNLPFMDGIHFIVLALWADWNLTGDTTTFTASQSAIDDCLAAVPRSVNGCVYSDPADPSVDYGFTDTVKKTGDVAYGTALQAWAYKMLDEISGGGSSTAESDTYANLRADAEAGLATLRQGDGWYAASSVNNAAKDDVWATALIVAEELVTGADRTASAQTIADAYLNGGPNGAGYESEITEFGMIRHLPAGQFWVNTTTTANRYQNGAFWLTPLWDVVRAISVVDHTLARQLAAEALQTIQDQANASGYVDAAWEWHNYPGLKGAEGYAPSAAIVNRFV